MMNRTINLRANLAGNFANDESLLDYEREVEAMRAAMTTHFCIAPRQSLRSAIDGRILTGGMAVQLADIPGTPDDPAWRVRERLVWQGVILERN